jgi:ubiquitin-protein ligase
VPLLSVCCVPQAVVWHSVGSMPEAAKAGQPPWQHLSGIKRITSEFKHLHRSVQNGQSNQLSNLILVNDEVTQWRFELKNFDDSVATGHQLNQDLQLMSQHHQDFLLMELTFPQAYPQEPPFLRVVSPRCVWYTGHVTAGGAICLEVLTNTGSANGWRSDYCAESIVQIAIMNMLHCESVMIRTASGGGRSGPLRCVIVHCWTCLQWSYAHQQLVQSWWSKPLFGVENGTQHVQYNTLRSCQLTRQACQKYFY